MSPHPFRAAAALAAMAALVVACEAGPGPDDPPAPTTQGAEPTGATASVVDAAPTPSGRLELTGWQQTHPGATSVALHAIEVDDSGHVHLDVEVVTGPNEVELARFGTFLEDNLGSRHPLIPPSDNPDVAVPTDSRLRATFAFEGPIDDEATHVTFAINAAGDRIVDAEDDDNPRSTGARLAFRDIPLPGVGFDDEADRGESSDLVEATSVDVEATQAHPGGVVVTVTRVATDTRSVRIDIEVDNPTGREVRLLAGNPHLYEGSQQASSVGPYQVAEVDDSEVRQLDIPAGGQASATLAFRGAIGPDVTSLELTLNGGQDDDADTPVPGFTIGDLPVPGRDDAASSPSPSD